MNHPSKENLLRFWQAVEALTPQDAAKIDAFSKDKPVYSFSNSSCPWSPDHEHQKAKTPKGYKWRYHVQAAIYRSSHLMRLLGKKISEPPKEIIEERDNKSRLFDFSVNSNGLPVPESFELSMAGWATGVIMNHGICEMDRVASDVRGLPPLPEDKLRTQSGFPAFDDLRDHLMEAFNAMARAVLSPESGTAPQPMTSQSVDEFSRLVIDRCRLTPYITDLFGDELEHHPVCIKTKISEDDEDTHVTDSMLNSFYIQDLRDVAKSQTDISRPLANFLWAISENITRFDDLRNKKGIGVAYKLLAPGAFPIGKWPSEYPMAFSQQVSVNALRWFFFNRKNGYAPHIFAVNGPPGTGKTTMLKDVIASAIVDRAMILSQLRTPNDAFTDKGAIQIGKYSYSYAELIPDLQGTSIVVASSNNGAVENISLELPVLKQDDRVWQHTPQDQGVDYFGALARQIVDKEDTWALLAARLGRKANRSEFLTKFWFGASDKENKETNHDVTNGMRGWLDALREGKAYPNQSWVEAVSRFTMAVSAEKHIRRKYQKFFNLPKEVEQEASKLESAKTALTDALTAKENAARLLQDGLSSSTDYHRRTNEAKERFTNMVALKPGFLENLFSLWKTQKEWRRSAVDAKDALDLAQKELGVHETVIARLISALQDTERTVDKHTCDIQSLSVLYDKSKLALQDAKNSLGKYWPDMTMPDDLREMASFWSTEEWRLAQTEVFLSALALHRAFIENAPDEMYKNLSLAAQWLQGRSMSDDQTQVALNSLALVVPVISSTFASAGRMLRNIKREGIGWLLIDEAGQARPQEAVGVLQRARRAVIVGDPLQLEPVVTISATLEASLAQAYGIDKPWWPSLTSVQALADQANPLGTCLTGDGFSSCCPEGKIWVGSPLRVHRRCIEPMFSVSNEVAYDGLMVYGTKPLKNEKLNGLPPSGWIHVTGKTSQGHWVHDEGVELENLLKTLLREHQIDPMDIFLISPFNQVVSELVKIGRRYALDTKHHVGTIHTTQGKESLIVILVLGGDPKRGGAKDWAAQKPNLLNVAASRAKSRLYVIANREEWGKRQYFSVAKRKLPEITIPQATAEAEMEGSLMDPFAF